MSSAEPRNDVATRLFIESLAFGIATTAMPDCTFVGGQFNVSSASTTEMLCSEYPLPNVFYRALEKWNRATSYLSDPAAAMSSPEYQTIIKMGTAAVPLLVDELRLNQNLFLIPALETITGADPVSPDDYGNCEKMVESWLNWAEQNELAGNVEATIAG